MSFSFIYELLFPLCPCSKSRPHRNQGKGPPQAEGCRVKASPDKEKSFSAWVHDPTQVSASLLINLHIAKPSRMELSFEPYAQVSPSPWNNASLEQCLHRKDPNNGFKRSDLKTGPLEKFSYQPMNAWARP